MAYRDTRLICWLCLLFGSFLLMSCGRKGDPYLSIPVAPERARSVRAVVRPGEIVLLWKAPKQNTNETDLVDLAGFYLYRAQETFAEACVKCPKHFERLFDYEYRGPRGQRPEKRRYYYRDTAVAPGNVYLYYIRSYNEAEVAGPLTKPLAVYYDHAPRAPQAGELHRANRLIEIGWAEVRVLDDGRPAEDIIGYNVYRTLQPGVYEERPLNADPVAEPRYEDVPPEDDTVYYYTLRAVRSLEGTLIESDPSEEMRLEYMDIKPPGAPRLLTAIPQKDGVLLKWMAKSEKDFAGYNIYRRPAGDGDFRKLNERVFTENSWLDTTAVIKRRYEYAVSAVDESARVNESELSEIVPVLYVID